MAKAVWLATEIGGRMLGDPHALAASLRTAAQFNPGPFVPELFDDGWKAAMAELQYIADELEAL